MAHLGVLCSFASQGIVGASLLTMTAGYNGTTNNTVEVSVSEWRYTWDKRTQGWIFSSYFIGYYVMQFPLGWLTNRFGRKNMTLCGAFSLACLQGMAIVTARMGADQFMATMAMAGLVNGTIITSVMGVLGEWSPQHETSRLTTLAMSGNGVGVALVYCLSAWTSQVQLLGGWPLAFVFLGASLLLFCLLVIVLVTDTPATNRWTSAEEKDYIQIDLPAQMSAKKCVPWRPLLTSLPVWAVGVAQFGSDWMVYLMITGMPSYFKFVRHMDTHQADMVCGLPWLGMPVLGYLASWAVDTLRQRGCSTTRLRKLCDALAKPLSAALLLLVRFLPLAYNDVIVVLYTSSVCLLTGLMPCSHFANAVEIAPHYSSAVFAVSQLVGMAASFIGPLVVENITPHNSAEEWGLCFGVTFGVAMATFLFYAMFASSEHQNWDTMDT